MIPHLVAIAEEFCRVSLVQASEDLLSLDHPFRIDVWRSAEQKAEASWDSLKGAWDGWHAVSLGQAPSYDPLTGFIEARNAIMHGLGELTRKQTRTPEAQRKTISRLRHAGIKVQGQQIQIDSTHVPAAVTTCTRFIEWLDTEITVRGLLPLA